MGVPFHARDPPDLPRPEGRPGPQSQLLPRPSTSRCSCSLVRLIPRQSLSQRPPKMRVWVNCPPICHGALALSPSPRTPGSPMGPGAGGRGEGEPLCLALHVPSRDPAWVDIYTTVPRRRRAPFRPPRELPFRHVHSVLDCTLSRSPPIPRGPVSLFLSVASRSADDRAAPWSDWASRRRSWPPRLPRASLRRHRPRRPSPAPTLSNTRMTLRYA